MEKIKGFLQKLTKQQIIISIFALTAVVICAGVGMIYYNHQTESKRAAKQSKEIFKVETVVEEAAGLEKLKAVEGVQEIKNISFTGTSIEKDLKIKIVDESEALVSGTAFKFAVYPEGAEDKAKDYTDEDMDGMIHIKDMDAGNYVVKMYELDGFAILQNPISVNVKAKIEYVKVDVKAEIKQDKDVDEKEDASNNKAPVEKPIVNTLPFLESTVTVTKVEKENVSTANFTAASVSLTAKEESIGQTTIRLPESVTLYHQGAETSKSCKVQMQIAASQMRQTVIQEIKWSVDNPDITSLTMNGDTEAAVSALQKGTTAITVVITYLDEAGAPQMKTLKSTVSVGDFTDDKTQLLDLNGNGLYLDSGAKQIATLKDYSAASVFYEAPKYTGWQTIDGKTYYFDENNQPAKGEQTIGNFHYSFDENGELIDTGEKKGIDVSKWNGDIDWKAVASAGIDFAIIRVGNRMTASGVLVEDPRFKENIAGATKVGIKVGIYVYSQAITEAEAVEEASMAIQLVEGYHLDYPIFIDTEKSGGRSDSLSRSARTKIVKAFCETVKNAGYKPGVYANKYWFRDNLYADQLSAYTIWVAQYNTECTYAGKYDMWQYTETGYVTGIKGYVDLSICYKGL